MEIQLELKKLTRFKLIFGLLFFSASTVFAQLQNDNILKQYKYFKVDSLEGIKFLIYKKDNQKKPLVLFITGSGFNPFFINGSFYGIPFDITKYADAYNFVVIQKPGIPVFDDSTQNRFLNQSFPTGFYIDNYGNYPAELVKNYSKTFYVAQHSKIIRFLNKQNWVQKDKIILIGHSQGALIAASLADKNKAVDKVILMSPGSIFTRFHEFIRTIRRDESYNWISHQQAQQKVDSIYAKYNDLLHYKNDDEKKYDPFSYKAYYSFEQPTFMETLMKINQRGLVVYGTGSIQDLDCDYVPLFLSAAGRNNITVKAYPGYDHNYFESLFDEKGALLEQKFHWDDVMKDVIKWVENNK